MLITFRYFDWIGIPYEPSKLRTFEDSNITSFKMALIFNRESENDPIYPVIPLLYSTELKETYEDLKKALELVKYNDPDRRWNLVADFKIANKNMGLNGCWCGEPCFLCLWRSRLNFVKQYEKIGTWAKRSYVEGRLIKDNKNVLFDPLIPADRVILPALHIKLGVFAQFVKGLWGYDREVDGKKIHQKGEYSRDRVHQIHHSKDGC